MGRIDSEINGRLAHRCMLINNCVSELIDSTTYVPDCAVITGNPKFNDSYVNNMFFGEEL